MCEQHLEHGASFLVEQIDDTQTLGKLYGHHDRILMLTSDRQ